MNDYTKPLIDPKDPIHPNQWKTYGFHLPSSAEGMVNVVLQKKFTNETPEGKIDELLADLWDMREIASLNGWILDVKKCKLLVARSEYDVMELETPPVIHSRPYLMGWLQGRYIG